MGLIMIKADLVVIVGCDFRSLPDRDGTVEIGYGLRPSYWGRGYATESVRAMVDWAFDQPDVIKIIAGCDEINTASAGVLRKIGMKRLHTKDGQISWELVR